MSGHSKFANIKHKKEKNDAAKGKIFTVIGREIAVAVKEGGADPANNSRLRDVIAKAKANNVPNDTIERGIKKASGELGSVNYEQNTYEGYGPARRTSARHSPRAAETSAPRAACPTCSTARARSSSTRKSAIWIRTS